MNSPWYEGWFEFRIGRLIEENPGIDTEQIQPVGFPESNELVKRLTINTKWDESRDKNFSINLWNISHFIEESFDPESDNFSISRLQESLEIQSENILFLSYTADPAELAQVPMNLLENHFDDFWYPVSDDLVVFDSSCNWILIFSHEGKGFVKFWKLN